MFSKELENLIQATLVDGKLEDYEKAALVKRAQAEGADVTELEIYINSILQRRQQELNEKKNRQEEEFEQKKQKAVGPVCPKCGKQVPPLTLKCDCGYEFSTSKNASSVQLLNEKIEEIRSEKDKHDADYEILNKQDQKICDLITTFPVPNTKEDIVEFLALSAANAKPKGGIFGNFMVRFSILSVIILVVITIIALNLPDTYEVTKTHWFKPDEHRIERTDKAAIWGIFAVFGVIAAGVFSYFYDRETLRWNKRAKVWRAKFDQVLMKGRSLRGDEEFQRQLDYYESMLNKK